MIEDEVRTEAFRRAIFQICPGKVVLEVGCGTGILSVFAAQAGASRVVAVEATEEVAQCAQEVVDANGFSDRVSVLAGPIEELCDEVDALLSGRKADVLVSEWMGFMLVCEGMFKSVAFARERWLADGGVMLPAGCEVWAAPFSHPELVERMTKYWCSGPYGVDLSTLAPRALEQHLAQPVISVLPEEGLLAPPTRLWQMDCASAAGDDPDGQRAAFEFQVAHEGSFHGLAAWFTCDLAPGVSFTTSPGGRPTHWEQTLLFEEPGAPAHGLHLAPGARVAGKLQWLVHGDSMGIAMAGEVCPGEKVEPVPFARRLVLHVT